MSTINGIMEGAKVRIKSPGSAFEKMTGVISGMDLMAIPPHVKVDIDDNDNLAKIPFLFQEIEIMD